MSKIGISPIPRSSILPEWFNSEPGRSLISEQKELLVKLVPDQFYRVGLQFGLNNHALLSDMNVEREIYCDMGVRERAGSVNNVIALPESLPLADGAADIVLLIHTLDYCKDPHRVLREVSQVLSPEGVLVLTGFHPFSLWGVRHRFGKKQAPFDARFISRIVVQDRLELLGFQSLTGCMLNYQPPRLNKRWRGRLDWMNKVGDRWWPTMGAVYMLVVQKKIYSGLGHKSSARQVKKWFTDLKPAQAKVAQYGALKK